MRVLFEQLLKLLEDGKQAVLVTVIASSGSVPAGAGARMLVGSEGRICGTIGGGRVEHRAIELAAGVLKAKNSSCRTLSLSSDDVESLGMICGGDVRVYFQFLSTEDPDAVLSARAAAEAFSRDEDSWLITEITHGGVCRMLVYNPDKDPTPFGLNNADAKALTSGRAVGACFGNRSFFSEPLTASGRVIIFGGGHVAQELVPVLSHIGFKCVVFEDRPDFANPSLFPKAESVILGNFEDISSCVEIKRRDYVVVMTRGHDFDYAVQKQVLACEAAYIGVIGSKAKKEAIDAKLLAHGLSWEKISRVYSPIGLPIKAKTPAEIAVSIAAQLIKARAEIIPEIENV